MKKSLFCLVFALVFAGCTDKEEIDELQTQQDKCLVISSPALNEETTSFEPIFTWNSCKTGNYRFTLSAAKDFSTPLFDTTLTSNTFSVPASFKTQFGPKKALTESTTYFWRVIQEKDTAVSSFKTKPYLDIFGFHTVNVLYTKRKFDLNPPYAPYNVDSTYTGNVEIRAVSKDRIYVAETAAGISNTIQLLSASPDLIEYYSANDGSGFKYVNFYYRPKTKSLSIRFYDGGLGFCANCWNISTTIK